jgi:BRCT domain type II-containing protein
MSFNTDSVTKHDLARIEASLKQVIELTKDTQQSAEIKHVVHALSQAVNDVKMTVEFDHEKRLAAIEEFLQSL